MVKKAEHIAFTLAVKKVQARKGSRTQYERILERAPLQTEINTELAEYIATLRSVYLATASRDGQPYVQHRGGPPGFLSVLDRKTLAFVDFKGNRQFISQGNLSENPKAFLFLMDYRNRVRIKVWGVAEVRETSSELLAAAASRLGDYVARPEQMIYIHVTAWEANCKQHIPIRYDLEEVEMMLDEKDMRIRQLEMQVRELERAD